MLDELGNLIISVLIDLEADKKVKLHRTFGNNIVKVATNISVRTLDEIRSALQVKEPIVDVFEDQHNIRIVLELPGLKEEDVRINYSNNILRIEVFKAGIVHTKEIPCQHAVEKIQASTVKENNSVVELTLRKTRRPES